MAPNVPTATGPTVPGPTPTAPERAVRPGRRRRRAAVALAALATAAATVVIAPAAHASGFWIADPDAPACAGNGNSGSNATWHNAVPGDWQGADYYWSDDPCWDYWMWTYGNGPNPSGDTVTWSASVGAGVTCHLYAEIPSGNPGTSGYKFDNSAHYTIYSGGTRYLGDRYENQATAGDWLGVTLDLGSWTAGTAGQLSVVLDDSSPYVRSGQPLYRVIAGAVSFDC